MAIRSAVGLRARNDPGGRRGRARGWWAPGRNGTAPGRRPTRVRVSTRQRRPGSATRRPCVRPVLQCKGDVCLRLPTLARCEISTYYSPLTHLQVAKFRLLTVLVFGILVQLVVYKEQVGVHFFFLHIGTAF
jgi:hypothetical protein